MDMSDEILAWLWPMIPGFAAGCIFRLSRIALVAGAAIALALGALALAIALSLGTLATIAGIALMLTFSSGLLVTIGACLGAALRALMRGRRTARIESGLVVSVPPVRFSLEAGRRYRVIEGFADHDGIRHEPGETWLVLESSFIPQEDGQAWRVSIDAQGERVVRMRWTADAQAPVLDRLDRYFRAVA